MLLKLKLKYRTRAAQKKTKYRSRTGPKCCNAGCGSKRKKSRKVTRGHTPSAAFKAVMESRKAN